MNIKKKKKKEETINAKNISLHSGKKKVSFKMEQFREIETEENLKGKKMQGTTGGTAPFRAV